MKQCTHSTAKAKHDLVVCQRSWQHEFGQLCTMKEKNFDSVTPTD